ncbi:palmitoyltransferase ZDHHC7-like [Panonychus citri]|uniref:palmitoyltransferase ZDHHC7-like n=1 Tax=Panonychus citri TaxID=50023 RepID=UPI002307A1D5|nr:palmitoyltransferase ZDHHC7-like [Panonychus citri]XP_053207127.1 palmitoyltransferase ZDHHC7-like [Panonychus citri]
MSLSDSHHHYRKPISRRRCDPCGVLCFLLTYGIVSYSDYAFIYWVSWNPTPSFLSLVNGAIYQILIVLLVCSHLRASFSDPGVVLRPQHNLDFSHEALLSDRESFTSEFSRSSSSNDIRWSVCNKCETYRPPQAHHCSVCQRCIRKMDHHCPWINNCVGELNQRYFLQFLLYVAILSFYTIISILFEVSTNRIVNQTKSLHTLILLIESLLFGIFVIAVMADQMSTIFNGLTPIDKLRSVSNKSGSPSKPKKARLREVCGTNSMLLWLIPCRDNSDKRHRQLVV